MTIVSIIGENGATIPTLVLEQLGWKPNDVVPIHVEDGRLTLGEKTISACARRGHIWRRPMFYERPELAKTYCTRCGLETHS